MRPLALPVTPAPQTGARRLRAELEDGALTTLYVAAYDIARTETRVAVVGKQRLAPWCASRGIGDAIVGGFFTRPDGNPLGEIRTSGMARRHVSFDAPWAAQRACVSIDGGLPRIVARNELPAAPRGDLLQAGPLLVRDGRAVYDRRTDPEGFSAGAHQFDSDITAERHPRAALAVAGDRLLAVVCDGRAADDAGLTLEELAAVLVALGAEQALNLDGGGSTSLVCEGELVNNPRADFELPEPGGRPIATALVFLPR